MDPNQTGPTDPNSAPTAAPTAAPSAPTPEPAPFTPAPTPSFDSPANGLPASPAPTPSPLPDTNPQPFAPSATDNAFGAPVATPPGNPTPFATPNPPTPAPATAPTAGPDTPPSWDTLGNPNPAPASAPQDASNLGNPTFAPSTPPFPASPAPEPFPSSNPAPAGPPAWAGDSQGNNPPTHQEPQEPAPTDLSQLSNLGGESSVYTPPVSSPETLVVPPTNPLPETTANAGAQKKLPKGLIIGGIVVLVLVIAASAYFILGIGKQGEPQPSSLPAQQQLPLTNPPKPITQTPPTNNTATGSGSTFGSIGTTPASSSGQSAIDLLRARQASASGTAQ